LINLYNTIDLYKLFSRTNRLDGELKPHGNIVCFDTTIEVEGRDEPQQIIGTYKEDTDEAIKLYADKNTADIVPN
jgi:type I site-specific restriction-modification system R (restriction) subunit